MANVIRTKDTLGDLFHKEFRALEASVPDADEDLFYELMQKHNIEVMPEDAGAFAFYDVGFGDGQRCLSNTDKHPYNVYVAYNSAECEYVFVRAGNLRGATGAVKALGKAIQKLVSASRKSGRRAA